MTWMFSKKVYVSVAISALFRELRSVMVFWTHRSRLFICPAEHHHFFHNRSNAKYRLVCRYWYCHISGMLNQFQPPHTSRSSKTLSSFSPLGYGKNGKRLKEGGNAKLSHAAFHHHTTGSVHKFSAQCRRFLRERQAASQRMTPPISRGKHVC